MPDLKPLSKTDLDADVSLYPLSPRQRMLTVILSVPIRQHVERSDFTDRIELNPLLRASGVSKLSRPHHPQGDRSGWHQAISEMDGSSSIVAKKE